MTTVASPRSRILPLLGRGRHARPELGACLMEYVSVLAGEQFSDAPRSTHPALAELARQVNDRIVGDAARSRLARLAPDLIGTSDPRVTETVISTCLVAAKASADLPGAANRRLARAQLRLAHGRRPGRLRRWRYRLRDACSPPAVDEVNWAFRLLYDRWRQRPQPERDRDLHRLLAVAVEDSRRLGTPRTPTAAPSALPAPGQAEGATTAGGLRAH